MINPTLILDCFGENFIGIRNYCDSASTSGYFLDDTVGIDMVALSKVATAIDGKGTALFDRLLRTGIVETCSDFVDELSETGKIDLLTGNSLSYCHRLKGNRILKLKCKDRFGSVFVERAELNEELNIYFLDKAGNSTQLEFVNNQAHLHWLSEGESAYLYVNDEPIVISPDEFDCDRCSDLRLLYGNACPENTCGCFTSESIENELLVGSEDAENIFYVSCRCSYESLLCGFKKTLARAIYYHCIGLFYKEKWLSNNLDAFIKGSEDDAERMYIEYLFGADDVVSKYSKALKTAVRSVVVMINKSGSTCVKCRGHHIANLIP